MDFNTKKDVYQKTIEKSIAFSGKGLDFYTQVKADIANYLFPQIKSASDVTNLLDIGCGHGLIHPLLKKCNITGIDTAQEVIEMAKVLNPKVHYQSYDGQQIPFPSESFDFAIITCVIHHVNPDNWNSFLTEAKRVVKKGGCILIFEHNPLNPATRYVVKNNEMDADANLISRNQLLKILGSIGIRKFKTRNILFTPFSSRFFRKLDNLLGRLPFGAQYYVLAYV
jgi:SAM-dependent methyltransferase